MTENKCNEWECPHNKDGVCDTNDCYKQDEILMEIHKHERE